MTPAPQHPYLTQEQFADKTFLRIRRRVALLRLPSAEGEIREVLLDTIRLYDQLLDDKAR
jgi:hypothetical protein